MTPRLRIGNKERWGKKRETEGITCYDCLYSPKNLYVETLPTNVIVLGGGTLERSSGIDEVVGVEPPRIGRVSLQKLLESWIPTPHPTSEDIRS